jgi:hypothetical protein
MAISDLDGLLGLLAQEASTEEPLGAHPPFETLAAYCSDELSPEEEAGIQQHLLGCRCCCETLLDFDDFLRAPEARPDVVDLETVAEGRRLQSRRYEVDHPAVGERHPRCHWTSGLAAMLLVAVVGSPLSFVLSLSRNVGVPLPAALASNNFR